MSDSKCFCICSVSLKEEIGSMIITKKHLPRRTFLRGMGVTLALPFLDSMVPAQTLLSKTAANPDPAGLSAISRMAG